MYKLLLLAGYVISRIAIPKMNIVYELRFFQVLQLLIIICFFSLSRRISSPFFIPLVVFHRAVIHYKQELCPTFLKCFDYIFRINK